MKLFKNYKKLYETELKNRKMYEERYKQIKQENEDLQVKKGYAKLKKQLNEVLDENLGLKIENAHLYTELEDTKGFKQQETEAKEVLKEQVKKYKKQISELKKQLKEK